MEEVPLWVLGRVFFLRIDPLYRTGEPTHTELECNGRTLPNRSWTGLEVGFEVRGGWKLWCGSDIVYILKENLLL